MVDTSTFHRAGSPGTSESRGSTTKVLRALAGSVSGPPLLLIDHHLDPDLGMSVEQAARLAGMPCHRWNPGQELGAVVPGLVVATLPRGMRRPPAAVAHLVDELFPGTPAILLCEEPLVQGFVLLHGGRLTLLGPPHGTEALAERRAAAAAWQEPEAGAVADDPWLRRQELRTARGRAHLVVAGDGRQAELSASLGLTALLTAAERPASLERDVLPTLDAWQDRPESDQLHRVIAARGEVWGALAHLDAEAGRWLLTAPGGWLMAVVSPQRIPGWWTLADAGGAVRTLDAEPGDIVLAATPLPTAPELAPPALTAVAVGGAAALAEHLATFAAAHRLAFAAVAMEVRP